MQKIKTFLMAFGLGIELFIVNLLFTYQIKSGMFGLICIKLRNRRTGKGVNLNLFDNFEGSKLVDNSIQKVYERLDTTKMSYIRFICYKSTGFSAELINEFVLIRNKGDRYAEISIPVKKYKRQLKMMLASIIASRKKYKENVMIDIKADMTNDRLVLSSEKESIGIDMYHISRSIPYDNDSNYFLLSKIQGVVGWYTVIPLWNYPINYTNEKSIIITNKQLRDNLVPPTRYFNTNIPRIVA